MSPLNASRRVVEKEGESKKETKRQAWDYHGYSWSRGSIVIEPLRVNRSYTFDNRVCILIEIRIKESTADRRVHAEKADEEKRFDTFSLPFVRITYVLQCCDDQRAVKKLRTDSFSRSRSLRQL